MTGSGALSSIGTKAASSKAEGFEAAVHRIKEQVLPRLLERVDPEAAATLSKDELADHLTALAWTGLSRVASQS